MALKMTDFKSRPVNPETEGFVRPEFTHIGFFQPRKSYPVYFAGKSDSETRENARNFLRQELAKAGRSAKEIAERCRDTLPAVRTRSRA